MKKIIKSVITLIIPFFCIYLCVFFPLVRQSVKRAADIGINILIPSLFPFFVMSDILIKTMSEGRLPFAGVFSKIFGLPKEAGGAFINGIISGYPVGASGVYSLFKEGILSRKEAERMLCFSNNSGPLFIICAIGCGMLCSLKAGIVLYAVHIISAILTGIICRIIYGVEIKEKTTITAKRNALTFNPAISVEKGFMQCIKVTGFVIFFAIISDMIYNMAEMTGMNTGTPLVILIMSLTEITNGVLKVSQSYDIESAMCIISFICSFSGLAVIMQTALVTESKLSLKKYMIFRFIGGMLSFCLCKIYLVFEKIPVSKELLFRPEIIKMILGLICYSIFFFYTINRYISRKGHKRKM